MLLALDVPLQFERRQHPHHTCSVLAVTREALHSTVQSSSAVKGIRLTTTAKLAGRQQADHAEGLDPRRAARWRIAWRAESDGHPASVVTSVLTRSRRVASAQRQAMHRDTLPPTPGTFAPLRTG